MSAVTGPIPQGDPRLLQTEQAQRLLTSSIPARVAYLGADGAPRVVATWFHWDGSELVMPTFVSAPHIAHPAQRIRALRANPAVAVTIDTEGFPPAALTLRGRVAITEVVGVAPEYAASARRYLGEEAAAGYLASLGHATTRMARISLAPAWVGLVDFQTRLPSALGGIRG
jgi:hypothetical protein